MQPESCLNGDLSIRSIAKFTRVLELEKISPDEFYENVLFTIAGTERSAWGACISSVPLHLQPGFAAFARSYLTRVNFMPNPGIVDPMNNSTEKLQAAKEYFRPIYISLLQAIDEFVPPRQ